MSAGRCFQVCSPQCSEIDDICGEGWGPTEYWRDFVHVYARSAARAKVLALRWFRHQYKRGTRDRWKRDYLAHGENPFSGMTVTPVVPLVIDGDEYWMTPEEKAREIADPFVAEPCIPPCDVCVIRASR